MELLTPPLPETAPRRVRRRWIAGGVITVALALAAIGGLATISSLSQKVVLEGSGSSMTGAAGADDDTSGSLGAVTNESPWPIRLIGAGTAGGEFTSDVTVGISRMAPGLASPSDIEWFTETPVTLTSGETGYLWYLATPTATDPAGFPSLGIRYADEIGLEHTISAEIGLLIVPAGLPEGIGSSSGHIDDYSYSLFMSALISALGTGDPALVAPFLGGDASEEQADTFLAALRGVTGNEGYLTNATGAHSATVTLFENNSAENSRPPITVSWAHSRWSAALA